MIGLALVSKSLPRVSITFEQILQCRLNDVTQNVKNSKHSGMWKSSMVLTNGIARNLSSNKINQLHMKNTTFFSLCSNKYSCYSNNLHKRRRDNKFNSSSSSNNKHHKRNSYNRQQHYRLCNSRFVLSSLLSGFFRACSLVVCMLIWIKLATK